MAYEMTDRLLDLLAARVDELAPGLVVEAGSGRSTVVLAEHARRVVSLEHKQKYAAQTARWLAAAGDPGDVDLRLAPLAKIDTPAGRFGWYDTVLPDRVGFALVDGPPSPVGRHAALFALAPLLEPGAEVWLDDANRDEERDALACWETHLGASWEPHPADPRIAVVHLD